MAERTTWAVERTEAAAAGGMVAAKWPAAAEAGAEVLRRGGNAFDAAVTTAFAVGVVEPWMSGVGGGGFAVGCAAGSAPFAVEFPMVSPAGARPEMFPLSGAGPDAALFGWAGVVDNANLFGHRSVAVPGVVAGLALLLERAGTISLAEALAPAIRLASEGVPVTWHTTLKIAQDLATLRRFPATAALFLDEAGCPPVSPESLRPRLYRNPDLAAVLRRIADDGPRAFYAGALAQAMVDELAAHGAPFTLADFAGYEATVSPTLTTRYAGHEVHAVGTGGTTLVEILNLMTALGVGGLPHNSPEALHRMALAFRQAFADRFQWLADPAFADVPLAVLTDPAYAAEQAAALAGERLGPIRPASAERVGLGATPVASMQDYLAAAARGGQMADGSTTHLSAIDAAGNAVSVTLTLLSLFGSKVVVPGTGILLNNGMMWFDPEPGRPNSVAGGKQPVSNMAPALLLRDGKAAVALGSSGGRRIMSCHAQLIANVADHGMTVGPAIAAPRIDGSTPELLASGRIDAATLADLARRGHAVGVVDDTLLTGAFASPVAVQRAADGGSLGAADPYYYPATAVGA